MASRIPVLLIVGSSLRPDTLARKYETDAEAVMEKCRRTASKHSTVYSNTQLIVVAFMRLHARGEIELTILHSPSNEVFELDIKGDFICPWPDKFFEVEFDLRFHC